MTTFLKRFLLSILVVSSLVAATHAQVNGEQFTVDGATVVHVWGNHYEMGYAHGYILSSDIMRIVREYMFTVISPDDYINFALPLFRMWMAVPDGYQQELDGMLQGMQDAGTGIYVDELNRDLTAEDLAVMNSIVDFWVFIDTNPGFDLACSSTCGWGDGTSEDPDTPGGTLHCRDMDWTDTATYLLGKSSLILAYEPSDAAEQSWISIAYPGYIGCLSGMNESGTGATLDLGNYVETPGSTSGNVPICMQVRAAIEGIDPNGDGFHNAEDVWDVLSGQSRIPSTIVHAFGKALGPDALDPPALVVESNHTGIARRDPSHEPDLAPWFIAATNHHRKLYAPVSCWRYELIVSEIIEDYRVDTQEIWQIETSVSVSTTMHTMLFRPDIMDLYLAVSTDATPAPYHYQSYLEWDQMFPASGTPTVTPTPTVPPTSTVPPTATGSPQPTMTPTPTGTTAPTATPTPTVPPTATVPPTDTPAPTETPLYTETPIPTETPAATATPGSTATPGATATPVATATPGEFSYDLQLNGDAFTGGDAFELSRSLSVPAQVTGTLECVILDVAGLYWFWPGWTETFDGQAADFAPGIHDLTLLAFTWPDNVDGSASGIRFWAALLRESDLSLLTNVDYEDFGYY